MIVRPSRLFLLSSQQTDIKEIVQQKLCSGFFCFLLNHPSAHRLLIVHHSRAVQASFNFVTKNFPGELALYLFQEKEVST